MFVPITEKNLSAAAAVHAPAWRQSHKAFCSPAFVAEHTVERQREFLHGELQQGKNLWMLLDPDPVGIVSIYGDLIETLYVLPEKQGMGYGRALLRFAVSQCRLPHLWVLKRNIRARDLYEKEGFLYSGEKKELHSDLTMLEMVLEKETPDPHVLRAVPRDVPMIVELLTRRTRWMAQQGLHQWNETGYLEAYPPAYFLDLVCSERVFVVKDASQVLGVMALLDEDSCWTPASDACYLHHLACDVQRPGLGRQMIAYAESHARSLGKNRIRLDCQLGNEKLNRYYEQLGYAAVGTCSSGPYTGILREKYL